MHFFRGAFLAVALRRLQSVQLLRAPQETVVPDRPTLELP